MGRRCCWMFLAVFAHAGIFRHELVDGEVREVSCSSLDDCFEKGFMTPGMMLHRMWARKIDLAMQKRQDALSHANASSLLSRQRQVRRALRHLLRAVEHRPPPAMRLVRRYQDESRGVTVLMLLFESWRGEFVPAVVYVPLGLEMRLEKRPAVLHLPGHLAGGLRDPDEQKLSLGLAQRGYVVLSFDPISQGERLQYGPKAVTLECRASKEEKGSDWGGKFPPCKGEGPPCSVAHNHFGQQLWLLGRGAEELFVRDAQRALDILSDLPFVNASSIGVVGCSGGGTLTAYLGAVDARVTAAAVACYFSTLGRELVEGTCNYDAEQIIWGMAKYGIDKPDMLRARAPQATAVLLTSHDCFPIAGGREGFAEVEAAFHAHGDATNLYASEAPGFHEVTETGLDAVQTFFHDQLGPSPDWLLPVLDPSPLPCSMLWFGESQMKAGIAGPRVPMPEHLRLLAQPKRQSLRWKRRGEAVGRGRSWLASLPQVSARIAKVPAEAINKVSTAGADHAVVAAKTQYYSFGKEDWFILYTDSSCAVTLRLYETAGRPKEDVVVLIFGGPTDVNRQLSRQEDLLLQQLQDHGFGAVAICGLCGFGDQFWRDGLWQFAPLLLGETHTGFHASEVLYTMSWAFRQLGARQVVLIAHGGATGAVLHAAVHAPGSEDRRIGALVLLWAPSFEEVARAKRHWLPWQMQMHGVLNHYDLPDLLAAIPRKRAAPTLIVEPRGATRASLPRGFAWRMYWLAAKRLRRAGHSLRILAGRRLSQLWRAREIVAFLQARVAQA
ncbi:unnamed protein product [Durusdinium trenchii]|uniref:Uncharacterized protein n=1 Tax=Durusdinium trenchii TaxID=1381693 RepID=A0ABP0MY59_9DINO